MLPACIFINILFKALIGNLGGGVEKVTRCQCTSSTWTYFEIDNKEVTNCVFGMCVVVVTFYTVFISILVIV